MKNDIQICRLLSLVMIAENVDHDAMYELGAISGMVGGNLVESIKGMEGE